MFDKFGEMGSYEEINELAANLLKEGDKEGLKTMASENGIPEDYVMMFMDGDIPFLTDRLTAAIGKLDLETKELGLKGLMADWVDYIRGLCTENPEMAAAVRAKGKSLTECMGKLLKYSFENRVKVNPEIVKAAKISASRVDFGIPGTGEAKKMIREYYLGGGEG